MRLWVGALSALAWCAWGAFASTSPTVDIAAQVRQHMAVVRDARLALADKLASMDALLELGSEGPRQLALRITSDGKALRKANERRAARLVSDFDAACQRILKARLDRDTLREIEPLQALVLRHARDPQLTKETIVSECDPALERLDELLSVRPEEIREREPAWAAAEGELFDALADERLLIRYSERCVERLERTPEGARAAARVEVPVDPGEEEARLEAEFALRALLALPMSDADRRTLVANRQLAGELAAQELAGIEHMNRMRVLLGLNALRIDLLLCVAARDHSKDMHELGFFAHESPVEGKRTPADRAARAGTSCSAENISVGQATGPEAITGWWYSPGHHRNMLGRHARVGLGRYERLWTQMFGG